jgi:hypothetical protein
MTLVDFSCLFKNDFNPRKELGENENKVKG